MSDGKADILHNVLIGQKSNECSYKSTLCNIAWAKYGKEASKRQRILRNEKTGFYWRGIYCQNCGSKQG